MVLIKMNGNCVVDGKAVIVGSDLKGNVIKFWTYMGTLDVPLEVAISILKEKPQRFDLVNKDIENKIKKLIDFKPEKKKLKVSKKFDLTYKKLNKMTKDDINDYAAKLNYEVNPSKQSKSIMIKSLVKQIENRTGYKVLRS